jgi:hypothetical protein
VLQAEHEQSRCRGNESAIGPVAFEEGTDAVRAVFGPSRKRADLDYDTAVKELASKSDRAALAAKTAAASLLQPATAPAAAYTFPDRKTGPSKPAGFA